MMGIPPIPKSIVPPPSGVGAGVVAGVGAGVVAGVVAGVSCPTKSETNGYANKPISTRFTTL